MLAAQLASMSLAIVLENCLGPNYSTNFSGMQFLASKYGKKSTLRVMTAVQNDLCLVGIVVF